MQQATLSRELRILMLEDTPTDAELMAHELRKANIDFISKRVETRAAFILALAEFQPDIVLSDYQLPDFDGLAALQIVRRDYPHIPVIMVTGALSDIDAVELLHLGARDYVLKDRLARLASAVQQALSAEQGIRARKAAEREVRIAEEKYRTLFVEASDGIVLIDDTGLIVQCNPEFERQTGRTQAQLMQTRIWELRPAGQRELAESKFREIWGAGTGGTSELALQTPGGEIVPVEFRTTAISIGDKRYLQSISRDISEHVKHEAQINKLNRALRTLSACNVALVRAQTEDELFHSICRHIVEIGGYRLSWIGLSEDDEQKTVRPVAHSGFEEGYLESLHISWADNERGRGPTGRAIRSGQPVYSQNIPTDPAFAPWREDALARGYASSLALPLINEGKTFGALNIYAAEANAFGSAEISLLKELAGDTAYGIVTLRTRAERDRAREDALLSAAHLRKVFEQTISAIALTLEKRDPYTAGHQQRVANLATAIATEMGLPQQQIEGIYLGSLLHNIGTVSVPAEILNRPSKLTELQFALVKQHSLTGFEIVKDIPFPWPVADMVLQHHERMDGSGYPQGLAGEQIMLEARIIAVADVLEAMRAYRPYRPAKHLDEAFVMLEQGSGTLFDPAVVDACVRIMRNGEFSLEETK
ncbi:MAG: GAF domain-containing protein [Gallionella sp.]|nr:GAF domain-containing protein [Gallionella sp.]MDP1941753.1 GAF domain-containing protein [Gallionella sp.]